MSEETHNTQDKNVIEENKKNKSELASVEDHSLAQAEEKHLVTDDMLMGVYGEILERNKKDRNEVDDILSNFVEMVINEGDASNASKEALVNLIKIKTDITDKDIKIADLMTRILLKEKNTMPDWQKAKQNTINIIDQTGTSKRALIEAIEKSKGKSQ